MKSARTQPDPPHVPTSRRLSTRGAARVLGLGEGWGDSTVPRQTVSFKLLDVLYLTTS